MLWVVTGLVVALAGGAWPPAVADVVVGVPGLVAVAVLGRLFPSGALALTVLLAQGDSRGYLAVVVAAFLVGRRTAAGPGPLGWAVAVAGPALLGAAFTDPLPTDLAELPARLLGTAVLPWLVGRHLYQRVLLQRAGWEHAGRLEREQGMVAERTRLRERARIARDMHDSLGHDLSLLGLRAAALETAPELRAERRVQAAELRAGAGAATERLREIIGVLREDHDAAPVDPVHQDVAALVDGCRASGMVVTYESDPVPATGLPRMVDLAVYRIVQESLTNAAKHAAGAVVRVGVTHAHDVTVVDVGNDSGLPDSDDPRVSTPMVSGGGHGVTGMRERARLVGGTLDATATGDGFRVLARLPHRGTPGPPLVAAGHIEETRRLRVGFAKALAWVGGGVLVAVSAYAYAMQGTAIAPDDYRRMQVGQPRAELAGKVPGRQYAQRPYHEPPFPAGAVCEYYTDGDLLPTRGFRLCFVRGLLATKDEVRFGRHADSGDGGRTPGTTDE